MSALPHSVRRQTVEIQVASEEIALKLQPRIVDLNRSRLLPAIERVLDELAVPGRRIRIDRLELDLGLVPLAHLESAAEERLVRALRKAVREALDGSLHGASGAAATVRWQTEEASRGELLESVLVHGTAPFWAPRPVPSLQELVSGMAVSDPAGLADAVRRCGLRRHVLERLAAQLADPVLETLVGLLEPRHAGLILEYVGDLREAHRVEPVLPVTGNALARLLWVLVQTYLVEDPGSQFNRKSFVRSLLEGLAAARGLDYARILAALRLGLERMEKRHPLRSSLPAVVAELVREELKAPSPPAPLPSPAQPPAGRGETRSGKPPGGSPSLRESLAAARAAGARQLLRLVREAPELRPEVVRSAPAPVFERMLDELCPGESGVLRALLAALAAIPAPYRPRPDSLIREVVFAATVRLGRGEAPGESFFSHVLRGLFAWPVAEPVRRTLREHAAAWSDAGRLPALRIAAFRSAIEAAAGGGKPGSPMLALQPLADGELRLALLELLDEPPEAAAVALRRQAADRRTRERWARLLPETALVRLAAVLEPRRHRVLLGAAEVLSAAWRQTAPPRHPVLTSRRAFWAFVLELLARPAGERTLDRLVGGFFTRSAARTAAMAPESPATLAEDGARLLAAADRLARQGGHAVLLAVLERDRGLLLAPWESTRRAAALRDRGTQPRESRSARRPARPRQRTDPTERADPSDPLYVDNAGLVLAGAFLPQLFQALEMLEAGDDGVARLRDAETASRAVHLLQYLVDGTTATPEPRLVLNKLLCGLEPAVPIDGSIEPTEREIAVCDTLLRSLLAGWPALANTSAAGLRETFLQREGKLERGDDGWRLRVGRKTVDVLVDEVPWSLSVILHRWMPRPIHVTW